MVTIKDDNLCVSTTNKGLVLEIEYDHNGDELYNFETEAASKNIMLLLSPIIIQT